MWTADTKARFPGNMSSFLPVKRIDHSNQRRYPMEEIIKSYFRMVNEDEFDAFFSLFDPQVKFQGPFDFKANNLEELKPYYLDIPNNYQEHIDTPVDIFISGNKAAVFIDFCGKTKKGQDITFKAMDHFVIEDGKIKSLHIFFDSFTFLNKIRKS
jgi:ketosteroid isomerase-like protein